MELLWLRWLLLDLSGGCLVSLDLLLSIGNWALALLLLLILLLLLVLLVALLKLMLGSGGDLSDGLVGLGQDSGHLEHLAGTLTIGGGDDGGVDVQETSLLEEQVGREGQVVADTSHRTDGVGTGSQVRNLSQVLVSVLLLSQRILAWVAGANNLSEVPAIWSRYLKFEGLTLSRTLDKSTLDLETSPYISLGDLIIAFNVLSNYDLYLNKKMAALPVDP